MLWSDESMLQLFFVFVCLFVFWKKQTSNCNKVQGSRKEDEEVRGDEPQTGV